MLKLKLQYFGHLMHRTDSLEKTLMLGKIEGRRRRGWQRLRWLDGINDLIDTSSSKLWVLLMGREAWNISVHGIAKSQIWLSNWTDWSTYLTLLMFLLPILIPTCNSSSLAFLMMCLAYKLNKQGDSRHPCHTPFSILSQSVAPYRVLTVVSWPAYGFSGNR